MSETTNSAEIKITADASGVETELRKVDDAAGKTGRSLDNLARNSGVDRLGDGAAAASNKFVFGTKGIIEAIEKRTLSMELGKKGTVEYYAALGNAKGINPAILKPYLDQLDAVTRKTAEAAAAQTKLDGGKSFLEGLRSQTAEIGKTSSQLLEMRAAQLGVSEAAKPMIEQLREAEEASGSLADTFGVSKAALLGFAAGIAGAFSFGALVAGVGTAIDALADLDDIAQKTGSSVENLSKLQKVAAVVGQDFGAVDASISKLAKGMAGLDEDSNKAAGALKRLGVSSKDASGNLRDPSKVLIDVARSLQDYRDGAEKTALINDLLGKSGADLLPYLNDVAESVDEYSAASAAAATQATEFQNGMGALRVKADEFYTSIATAVLPAMTDLVGAFGDAAKSQEDLMSPDATSWADNLAVGLARVADVAILIPKLLSAIAGSFKVVGADVTLFAAGLENLSPTTAFRKYMNGGSPSVDLAKALAERNKVLEDANKKYDSLWNAPANQIEQSMLKRLADRTATFKDAFGDQFQNAVAAYGKKSLGGGSGTGDGGATARAAAIKKEADAYQSLAAAISEKIAAAQMEANGQDKLTESTKLLISLEKQLESGRLRMLPVQEQAYRAQIAQLAVQEQVIASNVRARKAGEDWAKMEKSLADAASKSVEDAIREADANERLADTFGMTKSAIEAVALARLEEQLAQERSGRGVLSEIERLEKLIDAKKRSVVALNSVDTQEAAKKANADMLADWTKTVDKYEDVFRNGFADMLNNGKDGWKSFTKSLVTTFKTTVADQIYKMFAQPFVVKMVAAFAGGGTATGAQAATGADPISNMVQSAEKAYSAISSGFSTISTSVASGVQTGLGYAGVSSGTASAAGQMAGTASGYLAGAAVGVYGGRAISGGYAISGSGNGLVNAGTAVGAILGGPIGAAIGGVIAGTANRLFGMKAKEFGPTIVNGSFGASGFAGTNDTSFTQKGGVFRSDKSGVEKVAVDAATSKAFTAGYDALKLASADFAKTLSVNADSIKTRTQSLSVTLTKDAAENEKAIAAFFTGVADQLARELVPNLAELSKAGESAGAALQRIAGNYAFIDVALNAIGKEFGAVGLGSVSARERLVELSGGIEALGKGSAFFAANYLSEAERMEPVAKRVAAAFAELGLSGVSTRDQFKEIVLGLDLTTAKGATTYAGLINIQEAFAQLNPVMVETGKAIRSLADIASERAGLQEELEKLTLSPEQMLAKQRAKIAPSNVGLFDQVQGAQAARALSAINKTYEDQIAEFVKGILTITQVRELEIAGMDATTVALYDQVAALKQVAADVAAAQAKVDGIASANAGFQQQIDTILKGTMSAADLRQFETKGMDASTVALYDRLKGLEAEQVAAQEAARVAAEAAAAQQQAAAAAAQASQALREAYRSITDSIFDEVARIRGLLGSKDQSFAGAQSAFAIASAQARSGDMDAAKLLPQLSQSLLSLAESSAASLLDLQRIRAQTAASLTATGNLVANIGGIAPRPASQLNSAPAVATNIFTDRASSDEQTRVLYASMTRKASADPAAVEAAKKETADLRAEMQSIAISSAKTASLLARVIDGDTIKTQGATV